MARIAALSILGVLGVLAVRKYYADRDFKTLFGSEKAISTVKSAAEVNAYRLAGRQQPKSPDEYKVASGPVKVRTSSIVELSETLLDHSIYGWDFAKLCLPMNGVRVQFVRDDDTVDVLFCFECDILTVFHNGKAVGMEDFDDGRSRFVSVMKSLFPDDKAIQSLNPARLN